MFLTPNSATGSATERSGEGNVFSRVSLSSPYRAMALQSRVPALASDPCLHSPPPKLFKLV